jgi:hypothetical protein
LPHLSYREVDIGIGICDQRPATPCCASPDSASSSLSRIHSPTADEKMGFAIQLRK